MSEESSCKDLDGQLPRTDFFTNLLKMHINLAPNEPPPVTLRERSHFSPLLESQSLPDFHTHQWNSGLSSDEEETPAYTLMHTRNRTHNHNQSNNSLPPRNIGFGLNGLNSLNQHHRHLNNSHHPNHIRNNHFRRPPRSHLRRRFRKEIRRLFVFFKYAAPMLVGILLGVFLFVIILKASHTKPQDNFLLSHSCNGTTQVCITPNTIQRDLEVARTIEIFLSNQAGYYECGYKSYATAYLIREQLMKRLNESKYKIDISREDISPAFEHSIWLFAHNPHWGVSLLSSEDEVLSIHDGSCNLSSFLLVERLVSNKPYKPIQCQVLLFLYYVILHNWVYLLVVFANASLLYISYYFHQKRIGDLEQMFKIINNVLNIMQKDYIATKNLGHITKYRPINEVRDKTKLLTDKACNDLLWKKAVEYVYCNDSRLKSETRNIDGNSVDVWRWIELDPIPKNSAEVKERMSCWQGRALDDYPPGVDAKVAPPNGTPSQCFRVENVFKDEKKNLESESAYEIEYCILDQCIPHGGVLHIRVDRTSKLGCVYVKMESIQAAAGAYRALHGAWYKREMLTVKYITYELYHKWFKDDVCIKKLIYPPM